MSIYRVKKNANYVVMNRTVLNDDRLSWKAKGLHAYMLSMPDDWVFYNEELAKHSADGIAVIKSSIKELKQHGYLVRKPLKDDKGKILSWETHVFECPEVDFPPTGKPTNRENHPVENQPLLSTDELSTDLPNIDLSTTTTTDNPIHFFENNLGLLSPIQMEEIWNLVDDFHGQSEIVIEAMKIALDRNKKNMGFVKYLLKDWRDKGAKTLKDVQTLQNEWNNKGGKTLESTRGNFKGVKPESRNYDDEISRRGKERPSFIKSV